jgi:hypothetical protein
VADCPAQFRNPDLKTTSGIVWRPKKQAKDCLKMVCKMIEDKLQEREEIARAFG